MDAQKDQREADPQPRLCPKCGNPCAPVLHTYKNEVRNRHTGLKATVISRRRQCDFEECKFRFTTSERIPHDPEAN